MKFFFHLTIQPGTSPLPPKVSKNIFGWNDLRPTLMSRQKEIIIFRKIFFYLWHLFPLVFILAHRFDRAANFACFKGRFVVAFYLIWGSHVSNGTLRCENLLAPLGSIK